MSKSNAALSHCRSRFNLREGPAAPLPGGCLAYRPATGRQVPARLPGGSLPQRPKYD